MTTYVATASLTIEWGQSFAPELSVRAGSYELKLARVEIGVRDSDGNDEIRPNIYRYASSNPSGGSVITAQPLRQGAPAATTICRAGDLTVPGTATLLAQLQESNSGTQTYEPPFDLTVAPGSALVVFVNFALTGVDSTITAVVNVYFEELRLSWHY